MNYNIEDTQAYKDFQVSFNELLNDTYNLYQKKTRLQRHIFLFNFRFRCFIDRIKLRFKKRG